MGTECGQCREVDSRQSDSLEQLCLPLLHTCTCTYTITAVYVHCGHYIQSVCMLHVLHTVCMLHVLLLFSANSCQGHGRKSTLYIIVRT